VTTTGSQAWHKETTCGPCRYRSGSYDPVRGRATRKESISSISPCPRDVQYRIPCGGFLSGSGSLDQCPCRYSRYVSTYIHTHTYKGLPFNVQPKLAPSLSISPNRIVDLQCKGFAVQCRNDHSMKHYNGPYLPLVSHPAASVIHHQTCLSRKCWRIH
jgi:hypothetical protein